MPEGTGSIRLNLVDGTRTPLRADQNVLVRVLNGSKRQVAANWLKGGTITLIGIPFYDNSDDWYTIIVHADGYQDAGLYPVRLRKNFLLDAYVMLVPSHGTFHFSPLATIQQDPLMYALLTNGSGGDPKDRYTNTYENKNLEVGALLTIGTAIRDMPLADKTSPLACYWEVIWDLLMPDRFWAWVDAGLADRIKALADLHSVAEEQDAGHFHPGIPGRVDRATRSWKQTRFDVSNVQLTFHESNKKTIQTPNGPVQCVIVEPDIDYYKDLLAHGLLEVLPNLARGGKTDPRQDYTLRWMATKLEAVQPDFVPPVTIE